jgi:hypothetical protein
VAVSAHEPHALSGVNYKTDLVEEYLSSV